MVDVRLREQELLRSRSASALGEVATNHDEEAVEEAAASRAESQEVEEYAASPWEAESCSDSPDASGQ